MSIFRATAALSRGASVSLKTPGDLGQWSLPDELHDDRFREVCFARSSWCCSGWDVALISNAGAKEINMNSSFKR